MLWGRALLPVRRDLPTAFPLPAGKGAQTGVGAELTLKRAVAYSVGPWAGALCRSFWACAL
jgi:hypothetical protein